MIKQEVIFNVKNLKISKTENIFATEGIKNVFTAVFQFHSTDWDGLAKTAVFENAEGTKEPKLLEEDRCDIPDSFFKTSGVCYVSVMAGDFMVTNKVAIIVVNAGYTSGDTVAEAKNYFEQILRYFDATNMNVQKYGKLAERFAVGLAEDPESLMDNAKYYAHQAEQAAMGIPGQVEDAKNDIDAYVKEKEADLKGEDGNVCFVEFRIQPPCLLMAIIKKKIKKIVSAIKKVGTLNIVLMLVGAFFIWFNWQMILVFRECGSMPETYACAVVAATIGECGICGWIRTNKDKQQDRKWQKQDEKEGREQNDSDMNVGNIDEEDNL